METGGSFLSRVTPVILTFNEAPNIGRTLDKLTWAREVVVVDNDSDDGTLELVSRYPNARCVQRSFDTHAQKWNFAIGQATTEWVLALDADYILSDELVQEMAALSSDADLAGYETAFHYCIWGEPIRSALYPPVTTLFRRAKGHYEQEGHTQRLRLDGESRRLRGCIRHDDRKPVSRWLRSQGLYAQQEAELLLATDPGKLRMQDRLRLMIFIAPWLVPLYCLTVRGGALDGWAGLYYALQRGIAESILALKLIEARLGKRAR